MPEQAPDPPLTDVVQVGGTAETRDTLAQLKEEGHISELMDGYRFGIAVAVSFGRKPSAGSRGERRTTMFGAAGLDPDMSLRTAIAEIYPEARAWPYRAAEDLAEQGVRLLRDSRAGEEIWFSEVMAQVDAANESDQRE